MRNNGLSVLKEAARDGDASLFVSIHADSLTESIEVSGATVYTLSEHASDAAAARLAERENAADKESTRASPKEPPGVADILFDLKRRETKIYAHLFSRSVVKELGVAARLNHNPERSARFVVLKAPDFPSVLLELGYLSHAEDAKLLTSPAWRDKASDAVAHAVVRFFAETGAAAEDPQNGAAVAADRTGSAKRP